jgi:hypothetical protein
MFSGTAFLCSLGLVAAAIVINRIYLHIEAKRDKIDANGFLALAIIAVGGLIVPIFKPHANEPPALENLVYILYAVAVAAAAGVPTWVWVRFDVWDRIKKIAGSVADSIRSQDEIVIAKARRRVKFLVKIIPGIEWAEMRSGLYEIVRILLPELLLNQGRLLTQIAAVKRILYEPTNEKDAYSRGLRIETEGDLVRLEVHLSETRNEIAHCQGFLNHVESALYIALHDDSARGELTQRLEQLSADVHRTSDAITCADKEVDEVSSDNTRRRAAASSQKIIS